MKVFLCETIHPEAYRLLSEHAEIISSRERMGEADALISRVISVGAAEMDAMPELKVIAVHGTGTDGIDLTEAKKRGIRVVYAPHMNANAVAELNVTLLLAVMRKIVYARQLIDDAVQESCASGMTFAAGNAAPEDTDRPAHALRALAQREWIDLMDREEKETAIEGILSARGFGEVLASVSDQCANVLLRADSTLTQRETAIILDLVMRQTGFTGGNVKIIPIN